LTGRFSGFLDSGEQMVDQFDDLDVGAAIAWGRQRAEAVLIRNGGSDYYSAGERNPDPERYPPWPPPELDLKPRRPRGFEALDKTEADPPVLWDVRARVLASIELDAEKFHKQVRANPQALEVQAPAPGYPDTSASFLVRASTKAQADEQALAITAQAFDALIELLPEPEEGVTFSYGAEVYPHRPGIRRGSIRDARNASTPTPTAGRRSTTSSHNRGGSNAGTGVTRLL
jgi:hypothetical protein